MPPCHGGDRRFESGRARQTKKITVVVVFLVCRLAQSKLAITNKIAKCGGTNKEGACLLLTDFYVRAT